MADRDKKQSGMSVNEAGHKGGQRVKELVEEGKQTERSTSSSSRRNEQKR
ncbi:hypothetical protein [Stutzerimonas azotifigens]|nr:hypothetical protein [Stutzerimonas azotifigens]